jgi:hypothetical protein
MRHKDKSSSFIALRYHYLPCIIPRAHRRICPILATFQNNEEVTKAVHKWLRRQDLEFCHEGRFELAPRWEKPIDVLGACVEKEW